MAASNPGPRVLSPSCPCPIQKYPLPLPIMVPSLLGLALDAVGGEVAAMQSSSGLKSRQRQLERSRVLSASRERDGLRPEGACKQPCQVTSQVPTAGKAQGGVSELEEEGGQD